MISPQLLSCWGWATLIGHRSKQCSCEDLWLLPGPIKRLNDCLLTSFDNSIAGLPAVDICRNENILSGHMWLNIIWLLGYQKMTPLSLIQWGRQWYLSLEIFWDSQVSSKPLNRRMWQSSWLCCLPSWFLCFYKCSFRQPQFILAGNSCVNHFSSL